MAKKMATKVLFCLVVIAILMSAVQAAVAQDALDDTAESKHIQEDSEAAEFKSLGNIGTISSPLKVIYGFWPYWIDPQSYQPDWSGLTHVSYFCMDANSDGTLDTSNIGTEYYNVRDTAHTHNVKVTLTVRCHGFKPNDQKIQDHILAYHRNDLANTILEKLLDYDADGVSIDFENVSGTNSYTGGSNIVLMEQFMQVLHDTLKNANPNYHISFCVGGNVGTVYRNADLSQYTDAVFLMGYDYHIAGYDPDPSHEWAHYTGAVSPYNDPNQLDVIDSIGILDDYYSKDKIILGVPFYGYEWECKSSSPGAERLPYNGTAVRMNNAIAKAQTYGRLCDSNSNTPWYRYPSGGTWHQCWYDDEESLGLKFDYVNSANIGGAGIWALGYEGNNANIWNVINEIFGEPLFTPLDLCMVLDRSGSMDESMGGKTRMRGVKEAATGVVNVLLPQDRVSIVPFSDTATANIDLTSNFNAVKTKINAITAGGWTSFGAGLEAALNQFKAHGNPDHIPAILFMSDGEHNRAPDPEAYVTQCKNKGIPIFTVGFASSESEVDVTKLKKMSVETGGEYHFVSEIFDLQNIFLRLQHKASGWESVAAYVGEVDEGETITAGTFYVDPAIDDLRVTLNWPGSNLDLELFDPSSRQVDFSASNVIYSGDTKPEYVIIKDPQSGYWTAKVYGKSIGSSEEYYVLVTKYEPPSPLPPPKCKVQITSNPSLQDRPSIVHVNGNYYIAYQSHEKGYGIYIKEFDSNWKFKKKVEVASGSAYYDSPSLLFANNKLYVAYITNANGANANDYDVIVKEYNPSSLLCTKGAKYLTSLQSCQDLPALYYKDGYFYMAYQSWERGDGDIFIKKFDSNLNMLKKVQVTTKSSLQDRPSITYANGYFYVAYFSEETGYYDIFVKRLDNNLNLASWKEQITTKSSYQSYPFITFVNNQFVISYASTESGTLGIYMKKYDSNWNFIEKTEVIDSSAYERRPSHTWDGNNFWIAYVYNQGDNKDWNIFAIRPDSECGSVHYRGLE